MTSLCTVQDNAVSVGSIKQATRSTDGFLSNWQIGQGRNLRSGRYLEPVGETSQVSDQETIQETILESVQETIHETTHETIHETAVSAPESAGSPFQRMVDWYVQRRDQRETREAFRYLLTLDDELLEDIGVTRDQVRQAADLPLNQNAALVLQKEARRARLT